LLGLLQAPATQLARLLNEPGSSLARLLGAIEKKQAEAAPAQPTEAPVDDVATHAPGA
jgi:hypothetical protein